MYRIFDASLIVAASVATLALASRPARAVEYTCPSDPGFCYFDVANDGCFDAGTDTGPIDAQLEAGPFPDPLPPGTGLPANPGSIVCPPSVRRLKIDDGADWRTAIGSDILIFAAKLRCLGAGGRQGCNDPISLRSGRDLLLGGAMQFKRGNTVTGFVGRLEAQNDILVESGAQALGTPSLTAHPVFVESFNGDVELGAKASFRAGRLAITCPGDIRVGTGASFALHNANDSSTIAAGGDVSMAKPRFKVNRGDGASAAQSSLAITGRSVTIDGRAFFGEVPAAISPIGFAIFATDGDVDVGAVRVRGSGVFAVRLGGDSVRLGSAGKSRIPLSPPTSTIELVASDEIAVDRADFTANTILFETAGTQVAVTGSRLRGFGGGSTTTIQTGPASNCDLTDTTFLGSTLTENCGTIVGP